MIFKSFILLVSYFLTQNLVTAIHQMNMHDLNSIEVFINNIHERAWSDYHVEKIKLSGNEKKNILKMIFYDFTKILREFNNMSADSRKVFLSGGLVSLISSLEKLGPENSYSLHPKLSDKLTKILNISETINSYVESLSQLGANNITDDQDVLQYCPFDANARQDVQFKYERPLILKEYKEFVEILTARIKDDKWINICGQTTSLNQAVFDYYHQIIATYLKEYVMLYYIDIIDARCFNLNAVPLLVMRQNNSLSELKDNIKLTKGLLNRKNQYIYRCDPDYRKIMPGKSYYQLSHMIQTIIIAESYLSAEGSCNNNCELSKVDSINYEPCDEYQSCRYTDRAYYICESAEKNASRYYEWIKGKKGFAYGQNYPYCEGLLRFVESKYDWKQVRYCDFCMCTCIKRNFTMYGAVTAISFREQVTDIDNNKVAVGVRFVESDNMIHVQIKERDITSNETGIWKPLEQVYSYRQIHLNFASSTMKVGKDYAHPENITFDDLIAPEGFVVTGVRFRFSGDSLADPQMKRGMIQLQIRVTPFDYPSGKLVNLNRTRWVFRSFKGVRDRLNLIYPDKPTKSMVNVIDSRTDQYIEFQASDLIKDAGQSTVPFFDAQNVEGDPEFPLGGVGLIHRGKEGYGGFLAFKVFDINLSQYLNEKNML